MNFTKINSKATLILGAGIFITFAYSAYRFYKPTVATEDKSDISYASQKLVYLPTLEFKKPINRATTIIDLQIPSTSGTIRWYVAQAVAATTTDNMPDAKPFALRFCIPNVPPGQSPNKISAGWAGGLETAKQQLKTNPDFCKGIKIIAGHFPFSSHLHTAAAKGTKFTVLVRNPVEQAISDTNLAFQRGYVQPEQVQEYLLNGRIDNLQTRMLAGEEFMSGRCDEHTLATALENIDKYFLLAGVTEDTNTFMQILASIQEWGPIAVTNAQVSGNKVIEASALSAEIKKQLADTHSYDMQLYELIKLRWAAWKAENVLGEKYSKVEQASQTVTCIPHDFAKTRKALRMSPSMIEEYNLSKSDGNIQADQDYVIHPSFTSI